MVANFVYLDRKHFLHSLYSGAAVPVVPTDICINTQCADMREGRDFVRYSCFAVAHNFQGHTLPAAYLCAHTEVFLSQFVDDFERKAVHHEDGAASSQGPLNQ